MTQIEIRWAGVSRARRSVTRRPAARRSRARWDEKRRECEPPDQIGLVFAPLLVSPWPAASRPAPDASLTVPC